MCNSVHQTLGMERVIFSHRTVLCLRACWSGNDSDGNGILIMFGIKKQTLNNVFKVFAYNAKITA